MRATEAKIAVYGAGAMGTVLGSFLTLGGLKNVHLITRNAEHIFAMQERGALVECTANSVKKSTPVTALLPAQMEEYDVIFLMTKQRRNAEIIEDLLPHLTENGIICTTQNGLPEEGISEIIGKERTYGMVTAFGAELLRPGVVKMTSSLEAMSVELGGYQNDNGRTELLAEILSYAAKVSGNPEFVNTTDNLAGARWSKLAINAAFSGLSVVTGMTFGEVAKKRKTRKIALGILRECMAVANAAGVRLATMQGHDMEKLLGGGTLFRRLFSYVALPIAMKKHKALRSGMLKDVLNGRKCEIDFIDGIVVKIGRTVGVEAPLCGQVVDVVHGIENGLYEIDYKNVDFFCLE